MRINTIALNMMKLGELLTQEEAIDATANYKLVYKTEDNVFGLISDGTHFDVLAYVDMQNKLFEHIYSSEDYDYPVSRVIYTLEKYGSQIATAHLSKGDMMGAYVDGRVVKRENIEDLLKITKVSHHTITYAVCSPKGYKIYTAPCHPKAKWLVHRDISRELFVDKRGLCEFTLASCSMYRVDLAKNNVVYSHGSVPVNAKTLGYYIDTNRTFNDAIVSPYPFLPRFDSKYKARATFQWIHTVCDDDGNIVEVQYIR